MTKDLDAEVTATLEQPVVVYSKTWCPFCDKVKRLFRALKVDVTYVELDKRKDGPKLQALLTKKFKHRTVPMVFIAGRLIGGADDTERLHGKKKLLPLVTKATGSARSAKPARSNKGTKKAKKNRLSLKKGHGSLKALPVPSYSSSDSSSSGDSAESSSPVFSSSSSSGSESSTGYFSSDEGSEWSSAPRPGERVSREDQNEKYVSLGTSQKKKKKCLQRCVIS